MKTNSENESKAPGDSAARSENNAQSQTTPPDAGLQVSSTSTPLEVPVFNCLVYVASRQQGGVRARVANLPDLQCEAASEREALAKLVPAFKKRVGDLTSSGTDIPWIDPPMPVVDGEQTRFIPVHL